MKSLKFIILAFSLNLVGHADPEPEDVTEVETTTDITTATELLEDLDQLQGVPEESEIDLQNYYNVGSGRTIGLPLDEEEEEGEETTEEETTEAESTTPAAGAPPISPAANTAPGMTAISNSSVSNAQPPPAAPAGLAAQSGGDAAKAASSFQAETAEGVWLMTIASLMIVMTNVF